MEDNKKAPVISFTEKNYKSLSVATFILVVILLLSTLFRGCSSQTSSLKKEIINIHQEIDSLKARNEATQQLMSADLRLILNNLNLMNQSIVEISGNIGKINPNLSIRVQREGD